MRDTQVATHEFLAGDVERETFQPGALARNCPHAFPRHVDVDESEILERAAVRRDQLFDESVRDAELVGQSQRERRERAAPCLREGDDGRPKRWRATGW